MATAANVIDNIQYTFGNVSDAEALFWLQKAHTMFLRDMPIQTSTITETALVSGTQEYATSGLSTAMAVWSVRYLRTSTVSDAKQLIATSVDELDQTVPNWRGKDAAEPDYFYLRGGNIGLYRKPDTSSSASYPQLSIEITANTTLASGTTMPTNINDYSAWEDYVCWRLALKEKDERAGMFYSAYKESKAALYRQFHKNARLRVRVVPHTGGEQIVRE